MPLFFAGASVVSCSFLTSLDGVSGGESPKAEDSGPEVVTPSDKDTAPANDVVAPDGALVDGKAAERPNLVGYWSFDEGAGVVAKDGSGKNHDMLLLNGPTWVAGHQGGAIHLDGMTTTTTVDAFNGTGFPTSGTLSFWFNAEPDAEWILDHYDTNRDHIFLRIGQASGTEPLHIEASGMVGMADGAYNGAFVASAPISNGTWTHAIVVWDTTARKSYFYVDGALIKADGLDLGWAPREQLFVFGQKGCCGGFIGALDEIRLFDRAIPPDEIPLIP